MKQHRRELRDAVANKSPPVRLMALNWSLDKPRAMLHRICADRVMNRGDKHQSLRADAVAKHHEEVIWMFIKTTEDLAEKEVDEVVEMEIEETLEQGLDRAVDACVRILGLEKPTQEQVGQALAAARGYVPVTVKSEERKKKKVQEPRYYGFLPEFDLVDVLEQRLAETDVPDGAKKFWEGLQKSGRVTERPHITIVHSKSLPQEKDLWDNCHRLFVDASPPTFEFKLGHLVFDERVMALTVDDIKVATNPGEDTNEEGQSFVSQLEDALKRRLHITVGTRESKIAAVEAGVLIDAWKRGQAGPEFGCITLNDVVVKGRVKGLFN